MARHRFCADGGRNSNEHTKASDCIQTGKKQGHRPSAFFQYIDELRIYDFGAGAFFGIGTVAVQKPVYALYQLPSGTKFSKIMNYGFFLYEIHNKRRKLPA